MLRIRLYRLMGVVLNPLSDTWSGLSHHLCLSVDPPVCNGLTDHFFVRVFVSEDLHPEAIVLSEVK